MTAKPTARRGGWRRAGRKRAFKYIDSTGTTIEDPAKLKRIEALVIPPAWSDVWISPNAQAKLQATGIDAAGRRQYLYHPEYRAAQERRKYERLIRFGELLPDLRASIVRHIDRGPFAEEWTCALAVTLINQAWFRVGSQSHARQSRTYGVTTLTKRHATVRGKRVTFSFRAKHRVLVHATLVDPELAEGVRQLTSLPGGGRLFRYERDDGALVDLTGPRLNSYLAEYLGEGFTAKDFRTWGGTLTAAIALAELGPPSSEAEARRSIAAAMRRVGEQLGNTPAVARASYVSPAVIEQFRDGRILENVRPRRERVLSALSSGLDPEEDALLTLLRSWRIRQALAA